VKQIWEFEGKQRRSERWTFRLHTDALFLVKLAASLPFALLLSPPTKQTPIMFFLRAAARSLQSSAGTKARTPDSTRFLSSDKSIRDILLSLSGREQKDAATPVPELVAVQADNQEGKVLDIKLNTVIQELRDMKQLLAQQNKMQRLEFALKNLFAYKMGPIRSASSFIKINSNNMPS